MAPIVLSVGINLNSYDEGCGDYDDVHMEDKGRLWMIDDSGGKERSTLGAECRCGDIDYSVRSSLRPTISPAPFTHNSPGSRPLEL